MELTKMKKEFLLNLPRLDDVEEVRGDSIILIPTRKKDSSGYMLFDCVLCNESKPLGRVGLYDIFTIWTGNKSERVSIDLLPCGYFRIFCMQDNYFSKPWFHELRNLQYKEK